MTLSATAETTDPPESTPVPPQYLVDREVVVNSLKGTVPTSVDADSNTLRSCACLALVRSSVPENSADQSLSPCARSRNELPYAVTSSVSMDGVSVHESRDHPLPIEVHL